MKITIEPDSSDVDYIRTHWQALNLIKSFLQALGISEADRERWDDVLWAEVDTSSTIEFEGMTCYLPDTIKNQQSWKYSTLFYNSGYLLLLNGSPFWAKMTNTNAVDDLPSDLINFSCRGWPLYDLSQLFGKLNCLRSLDLSESYWLTNIKPLENLAHLNFLNFSHCGSLLDITPIENITRLNSLNLSGCLALTDITPIKKLVQLNTLNFSFIESISDIQFLKNITNLKLLNISSCTNISDIEPISDLKNLTFLDLSFCQSLSNITALANLPKLTSLNLGNCELISDITLVESLIKLNFLSLNGCDLIHDVDNLKELTQLVSLDLSNCKFLSNITKIEKLTQLTSLKLSWCNALSDITPLESLQQLTSLDLDGCTTMTDISPLAKLTQLTSLKLSYSKSLSDISPLAKLTQLTLIDLSHCESLGNICLFTSLTQLSWINLNSCTSIYNLYPTKSLQKIEKINIEGCLRITKLPDFKLMKHLVELKSSLHPTSVADILAHCALSRKDWAFINQNADDWLTELQSALKDSHPAAFDLATSLAIAFPHISFELSERLCQILQTDPLIDYRPWKQLFLGVFQQMGFNFLQNLASTIAAGSWPRGAIGGLSAIAEQLITLADGKEWFAGWVLATSAHHESNPSFLKPVAAPWCLALHCLGEDELLDQWIARFTDPDDSSALDAVFLEFGNHRLGLNDAPGAFRHAMRIRATLVRDGLLADIASHHLEAQQADQAAELLFLLSAEDKRAELSLKLADIPHFLDNRDNLHRLLAACGKNAPAIGKLLAKAGMASDFNPADRASICSTAAREATRVGAMIAGTDVRNTENLRQLMEDHFMNIFQANSDNSSGL